MAPAQPQTFTAGNDPLTKFDGAIEMANLPPAPHRQFAFHGFMRPWLGIYAKLIAGGKKPPTHFHVHQTEFFRVLKGNLSVDINGRRVDLTREHGEYSVPPFTHHVVYGTPGTEDNEVEFEVSAEEKRDGQYAMDQPFFENWYGYQEDVFQRGVTLDFIQVLAMFDAGDTYLSPPAWVPFRTFLSIWFTVVVGRYIGGLLGYAPFYPEWTTDWDAACDQMEQHWTQRRFAKRDAQEKARQRFASNGTHTNGKKKAL
ncbi:hypothetical protein PMIN06_007734 [Paraphaeosphaeria minitans]|uniref:Uncharacterized protein n=1 Tax=Paraphaeosphaeria minitans TaxID=565426 RepID=A0A9P6GA73_9PLEO|nr:hypothetical protein PMIN01_10686 [Paraphaeosphaeria minitans]